MLGKLFRRSKPLGELSIPGEGTLTLPAGKVSLDVTARPAGGGPPVPLHRASSSQGGAGGDAIWSALGKLDIPTAGDYVVTAGPIAETAATPPARFDPRLVLLA